MTSTNSIQVFAATTKSGKNTHWTHGEQGKRFPMCGQARGTRANGWMFPGGGIAPTCPKCAAMSRLEVIKEIEIERGIIRVQSEPTDEVRL